VAAASSLDVDGVARKGGNVDAAKQIGMALAERAKKAGVSAVVFDRNGFRYHGRVKAVAEGAREGGLQF
jgi:large subunit ribosomal protein L18